MRRVLACILLGMLPSLLALQVCAAEADEFKIKREQVFEFAQKPVVSRLNEKDVSIEFETVGFCDVTVAVEDAGGKILRHFVSGVLGPNAPEPFQKNSKKQRIVWDGKDDRGEYVNGEVIRVSLGLKPQFERTLFWSPKKRIAPGIRPIFAAGPEGMYAFEGGGVDHLRLFDHQGNYVRTVYPFPADYSSADAKSNSATSLQSALSKVVGLKWLELPQDGKLYPEWQGLMFSTLLTSGDDAGTGTGRINPTKYGAAASAMALLPAEAGKPSHIALIKRSLNRVASDGTTDGLSLQGPKTTVEPAAGVNHNEGIPQSAAVSPDGKWIYLSGFRYGWPYGDSRPAGFIPAVLRMSYEGDKGPELWAGSLQYDKGGAGENQFSSPMSIACDSQGRVYVADYDNDRIQVLSPDGKLVKSVPAVKPLRVFVHPKTGHIYFASWFYVTPRIQGKLAATFTHLGPVDDPKTVATYPLTLSGYADQAFMNRTYDTHEIAMDFNTEPPTIWLVPGTGDSTEKVMQQRRDYSKGQWQFEGWAKSFYQLLVEKNGKLEEKVNFAKDVGEAITRITPPQCPAHGRQRLYVNPKDGMLYVMEGDGGVGKSTRELLRIDPATGKCTPMTLPFSTEEIAFDLEGLIYLRTDVVVARYDPTTMREVPWDYGDEMTNPGFDGDAHATLAVIPLPGAGKPGQFHLGGFGVSPRGNIVVSCFNIKDTRALDPNAPRIISQAGKAYEPSNFPGRVRYAEVHVWDKHGKPIYQDAVPGLSLTDGMNLDRDDNIYALAAGRRLIDGKDTLPVCSETLMKFKPKVGKVISHSKELPIPLSPEMTPKRPADVDMAFGENTWVEGAEWMYGGVGRDGFIPHWAPNCSCWNSRGALDLYARSFVTELGRSTVAVLDTNGSLIMRIGRYGNVDCGTPLIAEGGPGAPRAMGGDEVALAAPCYVATHSDRRLFIADYANYRILSVKLGYATEEKVVLKDAPVRTSAVTAKP